MRWNKQKYVRLPNFDEIIIFDTIINHSKFKYFNPISGGFCHIDGEKVECFGESITLGLKAESKDSFIATKQFYGIEQAEKHCL